MNAGVCIRGQKNIFSSLGVDLKSAEEAFEALENSVCLPADIQEFHASFENAWEQHGFQRLPGYGYGSWTQEEPLGDKDLFWQEDSAKEHKNSIQAARTLMPTKDSSAERRPASFLYERSFKENEPSILDQGNLTVFTLTTAKKLLFNGAKEAIGVDLVSPAGNLTAFVRRGGKVFLNAGVYETPKLLMVSCYSLLNSNISISYQFWLTTVFKLSGIGPFDTLIEKKVSVIHANNNVGKHLIDRKTSFFTLPSIRDLDGDENAAIELVAVSNATWQYFSHKNSIAWGNAFSNCGMCAPKDRNVSCGDQILAALLFYGSGMHTGGPHYIPFGITPRFPGTRGNVTLASSNYEDAPVVHDGWSESYEDLSTEAARDFDVLVDGVQRHLINMVKHTDLLQNLGLESNGTFTGRYSQALQDVIIASQEAHEIMLERFDKCEFASMNAYSSCTSWDECIPSNPTLPVNDHSALRGIVFDSLGSSWHMVGTCRVSDVVQKGSMEVIGVKNLYISDLSVLGEAVDTHPQMTAMALGLIVGTNTPPISSGTFEYFPVILAAACCTVMLAFPLILIFRATLRRKSDRGEKNDVDGNNPRLVMTGSAMPARSMAKVQIMEWSGVSCTYETKEKAKTTLFKNSGQIISGELTALMGPS